MKAPVKTPEEMSAALDNAASAQRRLEVEKSERYRFEVVSFRYKFGGSKAYNFQLIDELPAAVYDYV